LRRGAKWGAAALFLSPVLPTASHPGAKTLSPKHFSYLTITCRTKIWALGGIDGTSAKRLPRQITAGAGAIGALKPRATS
jgi:thiamine-phosphate pyrophosphorylase